MRKPNFFIIGAPKCGTTAMYEYLRQHPDIFMPNVKEPHYFNTDLSWHYRPKTESQYLSLFKNARSESRVGEASVWYLYSAEAAVNIKEFAPNAKIIAMLRNPIDMLPSLHSQAYYSGTEDVSDFEEALRLEAARTAGHRIPKFAVHVHTLSYSKIVKYSEQLQRYFEIFGRENVHVIVYDDLTAATAESYVQVLRFLGVDDSFSPSSFNVVNPNKVVRNAWIRNALISYYRDFPLLRTPMQWVIPPAVRHRLRDLVMRAYTDYAPRPQISPELRLQLQQKFLPEVERLSRLLQRDLTGWCTDKNGVSRR